MPKKSGKVNDRERAICGRVKEFREKIRWPQPGFAYELGLTKDRLASIEYRRTPLRYDIGFRLCFLFDVNQEWLATGKGPVTPFTGEVGFPLPGQLPKNLLFSDVYDTRAEFSRMASGAQVDTMRGPFTETRLNEIEAFDPTAHLVARVTELMQRESFACEAERQTFALEAGHFLTVMALKHRRRKIAKQVRSAGGFHGLKRSREPDLSMQSMEKAKQILTLKAEIEKMEALLVELQSHD
jgi:hypothetical protein